MPRAAAPSLSHVQCGVIGTVQGIQLTSLYANNDQYTQCTSLTTKRLQSPPSHCPFLPFTCLCRRTAPALLNLGPGRQPRGESQVPWWGTIINDGVENDFGGFPRQIHQFEQKKGLNLEGNTVQNVIYEQRSRVLHIQKPSGPVYKAHCGGSISSA